MLLGFGFVGDIVPIGGAIPPAPIIAVDAQTAREKWSFETSDGEWISTILAVEEDTAYFAVSGSDEAGTIYGLKIATGEVQWAMPLPDGPYVDNIIGNAGMLYFLTSAYDDQTNRTVYDVGAVDVRTKDVKWQLKPPRLMI